MYYLSKEGKKELLEKKKRLIEKLKISTKETGAIKVKKDSCNTGFMLSTRENQKIRRKIKDINEILENAEIIDIDEIKDDVVCIGSEVKLCFPSGKVVSYTVGLDDPECQFKRISTKTSLGKEVLGCEPGEVVKYIANGEEREVKILNIT